jgi:hypothetical protein
MLIPMWLALCYAVHQDLFSQSTISASQIVEEVTNELPGLARVSGSKWTVTSLNWDERQGTYQLIAESASSSEIWEVTFDPTDHRVTKAARKKPSP